MAFAVVVLVPLAGIALLVLLSNGRPSVVLTILAVLDVALVVQATHRLVLNMADQRPWSAEHAADRLGLIAQLAGAIVVALLTIGQLRGSMHGLFRDVIAILVLAYLAGAPLWWLGGKRRVITALRKRSAERGAWE